MRRYGWVIVDERRNFLQLSPSRQIGWCRREEEATLFGDSLTVIAYLEAHRPGKSFYHLPSAQGEMELSQLQDGGGLVH